MDAASRAPPPQGPPPSYAFVTRVYRKNLRPVVLATAFLGGAWALLSGIGWFRNFGVDRTQHVPHIANLSLALGVSYMAVAAIGAFGIFSAATQRLALVRIYALLTALATLVVFATSLVRVVTHFVWKHDIISECSTLTANKQFVYYGFWGPIYSDTISPAEAEDWCNRAWNHDSWSEIVAMLILTVLAGLFTVVAFSYYRQLLDPTSPANASRTPSNQARLGAFPTHYNPAYDTGDGATLPTLGYGGYRSNPGRGQYAPPPGPPPGMGGVSAERDDPFAPPVYLPGDYKGYGDDGKDSKDPFSDFDGPSNHGHVAEERDVTSHPGPGGRETFR